MFVVVFFWFICLFLSSIAFKLTAPDVDDNGVVFRFFLLYIYFFLSMVCSRRNRCSCHSSISDGLKSFVRVFLC